MRQYSTKHERLLSYSVIRLVAKKDKELSETKALKVVCIISKAFLSFSLNIFHLLQYGNGVIKTI